jgi:hypothetical protein
MTIPVLISMLLVLAVPFTSSDHRSAADYSRLAREVVAEMNLLRSNPSGYAEHYIKPRRRFYKGNEYEVSPRLMLLTEEGVSAVDDCLKALAKARPVPALKWSNGLAQAAADHVKDQGESGALGHEGADGSTPSARVERYGTWKEIVGENIGYGSDEPREIVIQLLIDDGVPDRGHRSNILNPHYHVAGVAIGPHSGFRFMCVMDLAGGFIERAHE